MVKPGDCEYRGEHGVIGRRLDDHQEEIGRLRENDRELFQLVREMAGGLADVKAGVARIEGQLAGALQAKRLFWPVLIAFVGLGGSALVAALVHLARRGG